MTFIHHHQLPFSRVPRVPRVPRSLDVFPLHAEAWIHGGWTAAFATFALSAAAPLPQGNSQGCFFSVAMGIDIDLYGITMAHKICKKELRGFIWVLYGSG